MRVLLCIVFSMVWPLFMWLFASSVMSFVVWENYFVLELGEWDLGCRAALAILWTAGVLAFSLQLLVPDEFEGNS